MTLTREKATGLVETGMELGDESGYEYTIAVVDDAGFLLSFQRHEHARIPNFDEAIVEARTAARWHRPTHVLAEILQPGEVGYTLQHNDPDISGVKGGFPIRDQDGTVLGGIAADGGPVDLDEEICLRTLNEHGYSTEFEAPVTHD